MSSNGRSRRVVTSYEAAQAVRLQKEWQERYQARARELLKQPTRSGQFTVAIVGRSGVGKGSLVNHLLGEAAATVSHNTRGNDIVEQPYIFDRFKLLDIPGYDGQHAIAAEYRKDKRGSGKPDGSLTMEQFVEAYKLFGHETHALIFVVNNRITVHDKELMAMAVASRKFFCIVRTNADSVGRIVDDDQRVALLNQMEQEIRDELDITKNLDIRIFKVSIPWLEGIGNKLHRDNRHLIVENTRVLNFPLLRSYLSEPKGLYEELQIHAFVEEEVGRALQPFIHVKKRRILMEFSEHAVLGTIMPIVGPVLLTFLQTMIHTIRALGAAGLVEDPDGAVEKLAQDTKHGLVAGKISSKEGLVAAVEDTLIHIFGETIVHIAIYDLAVLSADSTLGSVVPGVGAFLSAARLSKRYENIGNLLTEKASLLHQLWIMQNVTNLIHL